MEGTGCEKCTEIMKIRGSDELCVDCQVGYWEHQKLEAEHHLESLRKQKAFEASYDGIIQPPDKSKD